MADDVVDTIAQYDLDDDFPDYANEQNKELNQIVRRPPQFSVLMFTWHAPGPLGLRRREGL